MIDKTLDCDFGTGIVAASRKSGAKVWRPGSWLDPMSRASRPDGLTRRAAMGRIASKRSTARRVTTSAAGVMSARVSARAVITLTSVNIRVRTTSRRKVAFL